MIVVDASVLLAAHDVDDAHHAAAVDVVEGREALATVDVCAWEVANVAAVMWRDPSAARWLANRVWLIEAAGNLVRVDDDLHASAVAIACRHHISAYDAAYVAAAERLGAELVSCDVRDLVDKGLARLPG